MKAAIFHAPGSPLSIEQIPDPTPGAGEVVIRIARCGICGSDLHFTQDAAICPAAGTVLGHEYAGEIVATGADVDPRKMGSAVAVLAIRSCGICASCKAGEPVWCPQMQIVQGGYAQYATAMVKHCIELPLGVALEHGALVEPLAVGLRGVSLADLRAGAQVLVVGAGPIGLAAVFWAKRRGAGRVGVVARTRGREELARMLGADEFSTVGESWDASVQNMFGRSPDVVMECVGAPGFIDRAVECVRPRGTVMLLGICTVRDTVWPLQLIMKEVRVQPALMYGIADFRAAADALDETDALPAAMVTDTISLGRLPETFEALRNRTTQCKVLVDPHLP